MSFPRDAKSDIFREVNSQSNQYLGAMYLHLFSPQMGPSKNTPASGWSRKRETGAWLINRSQSTVKG